MILFDINGMALASPTGNIRDLNATIFRLICEDLDLGSRWRDIVECADGTKYQLSLTEIESCSSVLHNSLRASPSGELLLKWGMKGMMVRELAQFLDKLRMERLLIYLRPPENLVITQQPIAEMTVEEGGMLSLTCEATGFPYPIYVWFHGDNKLSLRQDGRLIIERTALSHAGKYTCRVHHNCNGSTPYVFSHSCNVLVKPRPAPVTYCKAETNGFAHLADHKPVVPMPLSGDFFGVTKTTKLVDPKPLQSEERACVQIREPPTILLEPTSRTDSIGGHTLFVVKAIHPYEKVCYQWYHNSNRVEGAASNELRVHIRSIADAGDYQVRVYTSSHGEVLSKVAKLTVNQTPNVYTVGDKVALIIGISTYRSFGQPLPAVEHDLYSTIKVFDEMKFKVISLLDLTLVEMVNAVDEFCEMISSDVYAVFYCAGHGFVHNNQHYLIPWDARHGTDLRESLCIESVEAKIQRKNPKMLMMFLDICRKGVEHINPLPYVPAPVQSSNANKITIYAASFGEQSFEESKKTSKDPRGIFNQYLLDVLEKKSLNAFQVFEALQTKFKECQYNRQKFPQHPELTINLEESKRSLWDPIDPEKQKVITRTRKSNFWDAIQSLPQSYAARLNGTDVIQFKFHKVASNVMDMIAAPQLTTIANVQIMLSKDKIDPVLQPISWTYVQLQSNQRATKFRLPNLQRLQSELVLHLELHLYETSDSEATSSKVFSMELGQPLISNCGLGRVKYSSRPDRKEPMEHAESSLPLSESHA